MTTNKRVGRPATGRVRNKSLSILVSQEEKEKIKAYQKKKGYKSIADLLIDAIKK